MVIASDDRAFIFYFTHPGRRPGASLYDQRRSSIQVAEMELLDGKIICDRNKPVPIRLVAPYE